MVPIITIRKSINTSFARMNISYVVSDVYDKTNNSYSLWIALKDLHEDVVILEGDIFFEEFLQILS